MRSHGVRSQAALGKPHRTVPYGYSRNTRCPDLRRRSGAGTGPGHGRGSVQAIVAHILAGDTAVPHRAATSTGGVIPTPQGWKAAQLEQPYAGAGWTSSKLRELFPTDHRGHPLASGAAWPDAG